MEIFPNTFTVTHWYVMSLGWLFYWLTQIDKDRRLAKANGVNVRIWFRNGLFDFFLEKTFEFISSIVACMAFATLSSEIGFKYDIDVASILTVFGIGYMNSSFLNWILFYRKNIPEKLGHALAYIVNLVKKKKDGTD